MVYDLSKELDKKRAAERFQFLLNKGVKIELTERKKKRTIQQNAYLHALIGYFAIETGNTMEWVKQKYFKLLCNKELFVREKEDEFLGHVKYSRSSADLDTGEMTLAIERFRDWASQEVGIYLPEPHETEMLEQIEIEIKKHERYL